MSAILNVSSLAINKLLLVVSAIIQKHSLKYRSRLMHANVASCSISIHI